MTLWLAKAIPTDCQNSCFSHKNELLLYANCSKTENNTYKIYFFKKSSVSCVHLAGRRRSWEDQLGVSGREKCPGCDLLGPEALLWQYLPGAAGRCIRLSVAPLSGPAGWSCRDLEHIFALQWRTRLKEMTSAWQRQRGRASWTSVTYTDPVHQEGFSKV